MSPASNTRNDKYGGSFENRIRLLIEVVVATRKLMPTGMPLMVRVPGTDWLEHLGNAEDVPHWDVTQAVRLSVVLAEKGVDWIEVTTGGLDSRQKIVAKPGYQVPYAAAVKKGLVEHGWLKVVVSTVGMITEAEQANQILEDGLADAVVVGRAFLKNPGESPNSCEISTECLLQSVLMEENSGIAHGHLLIVDRHAGLVWDWAETLKVPLYHANQSEWSPTVILTLANTSESWMGFRYHEVPLSS